MDDAEPDRSAGTDGAMYLVEAYRPARADPSMRRVSIDGRTIVGVIDIPSDETVLFLVAMPDGASAERVVRDRGVTPIRAVAVRWAAPGATLAPPWPRR